MSVGLLSGVNFYIYEKSKKLLSRSEDEKNVTLSEHFIAAGMAGACISIVSSPLSLIKVQQQMVTQKGLLSCGKALSKQYGVSSLYRGSSMMFIMETFGRGVYMWTYEACKLQLEPECYGTHDHALQTKIKSAALAGMVSWAAVYQFDVIKARLMSDVEGIKYKGPLHCYRLTWQEGANSVGKGKSKFLGGFKALHKGLLFTLIRAAPVAAMVLPVYDVVKKSLEEQWKFA